MEENTSLSLTNDDTGLKGQLMTASDMFCSMTPKNDKEKALLFKAMNNPDKRLADCINMDISVKDVYTEIITMTDESTGEITKAPRIVLIDDKGVGYQCVSQGIFSALRKLIAIYGLPTWQTPIKIKIKQISKGNRSLLTFDVL